MTDPLSGNPTITDDGAVIVGIHTPEPEEATVMTNPVPEKARGVLYTVGICLGILASVSGPLIAALHVTQEWSAVIVSGVGAVTAMLSTLSRANLGDAEAVEPGQG